MANQDGPILVIGATGQQGGAVARELIARGHDVHALARTPDAPAAKRLADQGATLVQGDLEDPGSIRSAMADVQAVFSVLASMTPAGADGEVRQGKVVAQAAKETGVEHVVYSSVSGADRGSGVPQFESKWAIEQHLRSLEVPTTVLRPTMYIDSFGVHGPEMNDGTLVVRFPLSPHTPLQMVATADIGVFAANAFERPESHVGRAVELAGDELTGPQMADAFQAATGARARFAQQPLDEIRAFSSDTALMLEWIDHNGYDSADIPALRAQHPGLRTLRDWLRETNWQPAAAGIHA